MSGFDPDAFIAETSGGGGGFDPDAFIAEANAVTPTQRDRLLAAAQRGKERLTQLQAEPDPMSLMEIAKASGREFTDRLAHMGKGAVALGKAAWSPIDTLKSDAKRRQLERGVGDIVTLGYANKIANWADPKFAATEASDQQAEPDIRTGGQLAGFVLPGIGGGIVRGTGKVAGAALEGAGALRSAGRAIGTYGGSAPLVSGLHAESSGNRIGSALDAAADPAGLLLAGAAGGAGGKFKSAVEKSRGGQAAKFLEEHPQAAAEVGQMGPANDSLIGAASKRAANRIFSGVNKADRATRKAPFEEMKAAIDASPEANQMRDATPIVQQMDNAIYDLETSAAARTKLEGIRGILERYRRSPEDPIMVPERQLNGLRRNLMSIAKVGETDAPGANEAPLRQAAFGVKAMVDEGPYAELNRFYAEESSKFAAKRQQLGLKKKPGRDSAVEIRKVKLGLERRGQNTKTAGGDTEIDQFAEQNPQFAEDVALPEAARARADLTPRLTPQHGGLIERTVGAHMGPAAVGLAALHGGLPGAATAAGILAAQNATPIAGRILYPLTRPRGVNPLVWAAQESKRREARLAEILRNGGLP